MPLYNAAGRECCDACARVSSWRPNDFVVAVSSSYSTRRYERMVALKSASDVERGDAGLHLSHSLPAERDYEPAQLAATP